jgi:hypothetical protein
MKSVTVNAQELLAHLGRLGGPRTVFVCHSRGGLVARAAATLNPANSVQSELLAAVTFGTPHLGASLAESPGKLGLSVLLWRARSQSGTVDTLADLLCCYATDDGLRGVQDMLPVRKMSTSRPRIGQRPQSGRGLDMLRFDGVAKPAGIGNWIVRKLLGSQDRDLVVETSSSLPAKSGKNEDPFRTSTTSVTLAASERRGTALSCATFEPVGSLRAHLSLQKRRLSEVVIGRDERKHPSRPITPALWATSWTRGRGE